MMRYLLLTMLLLTVGCEDTAPPSAIASSEPQPTAPSESDADKTTAKAESPSEPDQAAPAPSANAESNKDKVVKSEAEWKKLLSPEEYHILREAGTERPFANKYDKHFEPGAYACAACGQVLFESETKFDSGCGWPAFYAAKAGDRVILRADNSLGMQRTEVLCARCDSHLGHIFNDAPQTPTGQRYCINSVAMKFIPESEYKDDAGSDGDSESNADAESNK